MPRKPKPDVKDDDDDEEDEIEDEQKKELWLIDLIIMA